MGTGLTVMSGFANIMFYQEGFTDLMLFLKKGGGAVNQVSTYRAI